MIDMDVQREARQTGRPRLTDNRRAGQARPPEGLMAAWITAVQNDVPATYDITGTGDRYRATNAQQQLRLTFTLDGVQVRPLTDTWSWRMTLAGYGDSRQVKPLPASELAVARNRLEYRRGMLTEWYLNGPLGLEQGFTIQSPPAPDCPEIVLELMCGGDLVPVLNSEQQAVALASPDGVVILAYHTLHVVDGRGRTLPARLEVELPPSGGPSRLQIRVDTTQAVYPILVDPLVQRPFQLAADDSATGDAFGCAVAVNDDTAVIGAYTADPAGKSNAGAAYVFVRRGPRWSQQAKLTASDGANNDNFGRAVAIGRNTLVVGAPMADVSGKANAGAAYVFVRSGTTWSQQTKLTAGDGAADDNFGYAVAIDNDTVLVGAPKVAGADIDQGAVYVFVRSGTTWGQQAKLMFGVWGDNDFGYSVGISGDTAVIGARGYDRAQIAQGVAFIYVRVGTAWSRQAELKLTNPGYIDLFGQAVGISGDSVVVGCPYRDTSRGLDAGAAYVFVRSGTTWTQQAELIPSGSAAGDQFGFSVVIDGDIVLVGSPYHASNAGAVYSYIRTGTNWGQETLVQVQGIGAGSNYGTALALAARRALIGASGQSGKGLVYAFPVFPASPGVSSNPEAPECPCTTPAGGEPEITDVSIRIGEKRQKTLDLSLATPAGPLTLTRTYMQNRQAAYQFMGQGWTHDHAASLTKIVGTPNQIIVRLPNGGEAHFTETSQDHYDGLSGVPSTITWDSGTSRYTLTATDKSIYVFDSQGKLLSRSWPSGETWTYSYSGSSLTEVNDGYGRKLVFRYYTTAPFSGQLYRVGDQTFDDANPSAPSGRYVEYSYVLNRVVDANGAIVAGTGALLSGVRDARDKDWTYAYYGQAAGETDVRQLNYLVQRQSPPVDTTGSGVSGDPLTLEAITYTMQGTELAVNGSMEADSGWTNIAGAPPSVNERSSVQVDSGSYSRRVVASAADQGIEGNAWNLVAGQTYIVTARVYPVSGTAKMQVSGETAFDRLSTGSGAWQTLRAVYQPAANASGRKLQFVAAGGPAEFFVDTVSITQSDLSVSALDQARGNAALTAALAFQPDGQDVTTETVADRTTTHWLNDGVYVGPEDPAGNFSAQYLNAAYRLDVQVDANGNTMELDWSADGKLLNQVTDALNHPTTFTYNVGGLSAETLKDSTDAQGRKTVYVYDDPVNPRLPTQVKVLDTDGTTVLRWQKFSYDSQGRTLVEQTVDPANGTTVQQETTRSYYSSGNGNGLLQTVTQKDIGGANDVSTTYSYDSAGRVVKTQRNSTFGNCAIAYTVYDLAGNVVASICNYDPGSNPDPTSVEEAVALFNPAFPDKNRVTVYEYDTLGRRVKTVTDAGATYEQKTLTAYDGLGRVTRTISHYVEDPAIPDPYVHDRGDFSHGSGQDQNLVTDTAYNERGLVRRQIDMLGNVTLFGYDDAGRLVKTVQNASQPDYDNSYGVGGDPTLASYTPGSDPAQDLITTSQYDRAGNLVKTVDALGTVTFTVFDALNRPVKTVRCAKDGATVSLEPGDSGYEAANDPRSTGYVPSTLPDRDLIETTEYDALGRVIRSQDVLGNWTLYGHDPLGRQVRVIRLAANPTYDLVADPSLSNYSPVSDPDQDLLTRTVYDEQGRVLYTADLQGERTWSAYDGLGRQVKTIVNAVGTATDGGINDPRSSSYVPSAEADRDLISLISYDSSGRVRWTLDPLGRKTWYVYDDLNRPKKVIRNCSYVSGTPEPEDDTYVGSPDPDLDIITRTEYDAQGRVFRTIDDRDNETRYEYDSLGRRTKTTVNYVDGVYNPTLPDENLVSTTSYDLAGRVTRAVDPAGRETRYEYDAAGRRTKTTVNYVDGVYNSAAQDEDLISTTTYNRGGQVVTGTDVSGMQTALVYDQAGRQLKITQAAGVPLATTGYTCYDKAGQVLRVIGNWIDAPQQPSPDARDGQGNWLFAPVTHGLIEDQNLVTTYTLDRAGRQVALSDPLGNATSMAYFKDGHVESLTDAEDVVTQYRYDRLRRRTTVVQGHQSNGEDPALWLWDAVDGRWEQSNGTAITFGALNDQNVIVRADYDKAGRRLALRDPRGSQTTYAYDLLDRQTSLSDPLNHVWATAFSDLAGGRARVTQTDPLDQQFQQDFDRLGRLQQASYLAESPRQTPDVTFAYDAAGGRTRMDETLDGGLSFVRKTTFSYDKASRLTVAGFDTDGDGTVEQTVTYQYDAGGRRTRLTLPGDLQVTYTYDARGQLVDLTDWSDQVVRHGYDSAGRLRRVERSNRLLSQYQYDAAGRLRLLHHTADGRTLGHFAYTVDGRGNRVQALECLPQADSGSTSLLADDPSIVYERGPWTTVGSFKEATSFSAALTAGFFGTEVTLTLGTGPDHGLCDVYVNGILWQSLDGYSTAPGERSLTISPTEEGFHLLQVRNTTGKNLASSGRKLRFKSLLTNRRYDLQTIAYAYDQLARLQDARYYPGLNTGLAEASLLRRHQYAYDLAGNRIQQTVTVDGAPTTTNYTYDAANRLVGDGTHTFAYDGAGRMISDGVNTYAWDRANRLLAYNGSAYQYAYDGDGRRIKQTFSGIATQYLLDIQPGLWQVLGATQGANTTRYVHGPAGLLSEQEPGESWRWPVNDALGSVRGVVDEDLNVLESRLYSPFGEIYRRTGISQTVFGFTGESTDANGLVQLRARYYNPVLGVFPSLDPLESDIDQPMSLNRYMYVYGNVIDTIDPSGLYISPDPSTWNSCSPASQTWKSSVCGKPRISMGQAGNETCAQYPGWRNHSNWDLGGFHEWTCLNRSYTLCPDREPRSLSSLQKWWESLHPTAQKIECALDEVASDPGCSGFTFDHIPSNTFDAMTQWITAHKPIIIKMAKRYQVQAALLAGILGSEFLFDYGVDDLNQDVNVGRFGDLAFDVAPHRPFTGPFLTHEATYGYANVHIGTAMAAYDYLSRVYAGPGQNPATQMFNSLGSFDENARYWGYRHTVTTTEGNIAAAAMVARFYADAYASAAKLADQIATAPKKEGRELLRPWQMALVFAAYRTGVGGWSPDQVDPEKRLFRDIPYYQNAAPDTGYGCNGKVAKPVMDYMVDKFEIL